MNKSLDGMKVAILATDGVEQVELTEPRKALQVAGATVELVSIKTGKIQGMNHHDKADTFQVQRLVDDVAATQYDALMLPGGVANPDQLRMNASAVHFVRDFFAYKLPVAAICHAPWLLVEADAVRHRTLTSWPSLQTDIRNAGGNWVDQEVVIDGSLVTSRKPDDLPAFNQSMLDLFAGSRSEENVGQPGTARAPRKSMSEDKAIDIASAESFPASDPPGSHKST
jgi:protease I